MAGTYWDELVGWLLMNPVAESVRIEANADTCFERLASRFPVRMRRIDWPAVPGCLEAGEPVETLTEFLEFWDRIRYEYSIDPGERLLILGDGQMEGAIWVDCGDLDKIIGEVITLPQHTYVVPAGFSWCLNHTFEKDLYFGFARYPA